MARLLSIGVLVVSLSSVILLAEGPPALDTFASSDGTFQFVYPENYELLVGDRILKATQGKHVGIPVCDFSTALACVVYPIEIPDDTKFEAAGFSVNLVPGVTVESECLAYSDPLARSRGELQPSSIVINNQEFRHAMVKRTASGHLQTADFYRAFNRQRCYELQIEVSLSEDPAVQQHLQPVSPENARAFSARESLRLILSSFSFTQ